MRRKLKQLFISYLLSVIMLLTMGMCFETESNNNDVVDVVPLRPSVEDDLTVGLADFSKLSLIRSPFKNGSMLPLTRNEMKPVISFQTIEKEQHTEATKIELAVANYKVISCYLNVRTNAFDTSKIIAVVSEGTILEVLNKTDNGWLTLKEGGYVNGKYAKMTQSEQETVMPATQLAVIKDSGKAPDEPTSMIKSESGLTKAYIEKIFKGTSLAGHGLENAILDIEEEFGINAYFTIAVMKLESAHGESRIARDKNNLFGLNAIDGNEYNNALSFKTMADSVLKFGQLIDKNYIGEGYTTVEKVSDKYCQANPEWAGLVKRIMKGDYQKL